jgi:molecular chaperone GrpE
MMYSSQIHGPQTGPSREQEYLSGWQRARAELENFHKRSGADREEQTTRLKRQLIEPLLDVADNFQAITKHLPEELKKDNWAQGVMHVVRKLDDVLSAYEITTIGKAGEPFDPARHEAITQEKGQAPPGQVLEVISPGYALGHFVIRPAKVKVSS